MSCHLFIQIDPSERINNLSLRHRGKKRQIDWDKLHHVRHEHNLEPEEKKCSCCGRQMDRIGEDIMRELDYHGRI